MTRPGRILVAFVLAVLTATVLGSLVETQVNLAALAALGLDIPAGDRLRTTLDDLAGFTRTLAPIALAVLLLALPVATWIARRAGRGRVLLCTLGAGLGFLVGVRIVDALAPMPTLIAATRGLGGTLLMALALALGGLVFALVSRAPRGARA
ncbi:hypothetical protein [Coralloluteibacterium thermophilus]|uniref:Uncharacterized protein n=1 Tax=Coralloluteibacterium thermophilum TaxID=2707049 RepID=A0ABV9NJC5_9GAMM